MTDQRTDDSTDQRTNPVDEEDRVASVDGPEADPALSPLSTLSRLMLLVAGWLLILIGIAGLILPGIQGIVTIVAGTAVLSLASEIAYRIMHRALGRWPQTWSRIERLREKVHGWLHRD